MASGGEARAERRHAGHWSARSFPEPGDRVQDFHPLRDGYLVMGRVLRIDTNPDKQT